MWLLLTLNAAGKAAAVSIGLGAPAVAITLWLVPDFLLAYHFFVPRAQGLVKLTRSFSTAGQEVWLTIDDGPDRDDTPRILELLAKQGAKATFFVVGEKALAHPELIRAIHDAGHGVAHHTHTHPDASFWCASPARVARELDKGLAAIRAADANLVPLCFRPPVGIKNLWLAGALRARGLSCIGWSARGLERRGGDADAVAARVLHGLKPGSILLLHEGPRVPTHIRVTAIQRTLERLHELGYQCVVPAPERWKSV